MMIVKMGQTMGKTYWGNEMEKKDHWISLKSMYCNLFMLQVRKFRSRETERLTSVT